MIENKTLTIHDIRRHKTFINCNAIHKCLIEFNLHRYTFINCTFIRCQLELVNLNESYLENTCFKLCNMGYVDFSRAFMKNCVIDNQSGHQIITKDALIIMEG